MRITITTDDGEVLEILAHTDLGTDETIAAHIDDARVVRSAEIHAQTLCRNYVVDAVASAVRVIKTRAVTAPKPASKLPDDWRCPVCMSSVGSVTAHGVVCDDGHESH